MNTTSVIICAGDAEVIPYARVAEITDPRKLINLREDPRRGRTAVNPGKVRN